MAERTWVAVILCCLVWFGYIQWFAPKAPIKATQPATTTGETQPAAAGSPIIPGNPFSVPLVQDVGHTANNGKMEIVFSDAGGKISQVGLEGYRDQIKKEGSLPIYPVKPDFSPHSLATLFTDAALQGLASGKYTRTVDGDKVQYKHSASGMTVVKDYTITKDNYFIDATYRFTADSTSKDWGYVLIPVGASTLTYDHNIPLRSWEVISYQNESVTRKTTEALEEGEKVMQGNSNWVSFGNRYFAAAVINQAEINPDIVFHKGKEFTGAFMRYPLKVKPDTKEMTLSLRLFVGPKDFGVLSQVVGMKRMIDYGTFSFLAYPMLEILRFFYKYVQNYGIAIILLTILVRLLFYPLSVKSSKSMKAMQRMQPQIAALKEKYKDDMQRFNQEQMTLFKTHKINPLGGCLPILVQIPVFIALYAVLANSIELFHAPFFGWIHDLSAKDPFYIFPVLMGVTFFVQQKITPMAGMDPMQQKMMMLMPVIMTVFMINLPSGLTVYFFLSNLLGIVQQYVINREPKASSAMVAVPTDSGRK